MLQPPLPEAQIVIYRWHDNRRYLTYGRAWVTTRWAKLGKIFVVGLLPLIGDIEKVRLMLIIALSSAPAEISARRR